MITPDILKSVFENISTKEVQDIDNGNGDYVYLSVGSYGHVSAERMDYCEETSEQAEGDGDLFCDMDDFLRLYDECGASHVDIDKMI